MALNTVFQNINKRNKVKKFPDEKKANFPGWYASTSINQASGALVEPYLPLFAQNLGATNSQIGFLSGLFSLINISQIIWAQLSLKFGYNKYFVALGQLLTALLFIPIAFLKLGNFIMLLILRFFQGLFNSATIPTLATLKSDYISEKERANKITKFTYLGLTGSFIGSLLGGQLFDVFTGSVGEEETFFLIFIFTGLLGIFGALIFSLSIPSTSKSPIIKETISPVSYINRDLSRQVKSHISLVRKIRGYIRKFKSFWIFTAFGCIFYFAVYAVSPFFIIVQIDKFHFTFFQASILTSASIIVQVAVSIFLVKKDLMNKYGRKIYTILGVIIITIFSALFVIPYYFLNQIPTEILFYYCLAIWLLLGSGWGMFNSTIAVLILDIAHPQYRSLLIAIYNSLTGFIMFLGPVIGGITIDLTNNDLITPFIIRFFVLMVSLAFLIKFVKEPEISGIELKPIKNVFPFFTRMSSARGPELGIAYGNEKLARKKHL